MLTQELVRRGALPAAIEPAPAFAETLRRRFPDLDVREGPAEQLPWEDGSFDVALAQLVVAFMDDAPTGVAEMARVANGRVAVCMWDLEGQELLASVKHVRERMGEADDRAAALPDGRRDRGARRSRSRVRSARRRGGLRGLRGLLDVAARRRRPDGSVGRVARRRAARDGARGADPRARQPERRVHAEGSLLGR